ncbi:hypothetical protein C5L14_16630 [Labrys okinawensis]|uniref:Uncharacterized protein n=2 Tax=Labrys okinawensis TaxID=346911 RepID=A0A2S9QC40_9HYPH|nr:hypothetical protein C5L14_16630 [Labrys okinawensis]
MLAGATKEETRGDKAAAKAIKDEVTALAIKSLREGYHSADFLNFVADLLEPKRGRPAKPEPKWWRDIGEVYDELTDAGMKPMQAYAELERQTGIVVRQLQRTVKFYRGVIEAEEEAREV